ncbi:TPA: hypothetical protein ENG04_11390, partial [Candidatus Poribacteria bacterium]|nr:hypothetical protein [Candidatus Poribacteria bacterium]HEX30673.1 hypothetical protein [Candidatus Poribacteria bacterium]
MSCWKVRDCRQTECEGYGRKMDFCWFSNSSCDRGGDISFKERFSKYCLECDLFSRYLEEKISGPVEVLNLIRDIVGRINRCDATLEDAYFRLQHLSEKLSQLYELSDLMLSSLNVDRVLYIILTAVTSGQALGLNRAFLFIVDDEEKRLKGKMAVGPIDLNEASRIWSELSSRPMSIQEIVEEYEKRPPTEQNRAINEIIQGISIPLDQTDSVLTRSIIEKASFNNIKVEECSERDRELMGKLG